ncbi:MAG: DNA polymerase I [Gammaproteobacteria bacterium]|nr:DNA polymerase I [Gammaproteobacteria bacterium]
MTEKPLLTLVDGSSYLYRAFHALPPLVNSKGQPTGAVYGVVNMLRKLKKDYPTPHMAVIFDPKGKTFRDELYPEYKAHRPPMPDELQCQIQPLFDIIRAMGLPLIIVEGVEADDVIGTLAREAVQHNWQVLVSTGDKDMAQLVNAHVTLINTMTNILFDRQGVIDKFGVAPEQIIDYLTLIGDKVDNVPGVPMVGEKTALKWLAEWGSLDTIIQNADKITGKIGENLRASLHYLPLSKQLVTIKMDVDLPFTPESVSLGAEDTEQLRSLYQSLEFKRLLQELTPNESNSESENQPNLSVKGVYDVILDQATFEKWLKKLEAAPQFAIDTETTSLDAMRADLVGLSVAVEPNEAAYIPLGHDYFDAPEQLDKAEVLARLKPILADPQKLKIGHNLKYDLTILERQGVHVQGVAFDTMLESFIIGNGGRNDMDSAALRLLNYKTTTFEDIAGKGVKQLRFNQIDIEQAGDYAAEDADITLRLHHVLWPQIEANPRLKKVFTEIEMPLVSILAEIERTGVLIDSDLLKAQSREIAGKLVTLEKEAQELAGQPFNLSSPKQLQEILYQKMGLPVLSKTPTGQPSTAEEVLQELAHDYPLPALILQHRSLSKLKSTYTDRLPEQVNSETGRVHTSYHQVGAATGRFSSSDPNLQNIPVRTEEGRRIRQAFIAPKGYKLLSADYSQIELRIMAHLSEDPGLLSAFSQGLDVHRATAAEIFGLALDAVTSDQRRSAKAINFGLIYGMSAFGLAKQLDIDRSSAQHYMNRYFERYPGVKIFMEATRKQAHEQGYVETLLGRKLYLPDINSRNAGLQKGAERAAINAPMQGTAADIIKQAMVNVHRCIKSHESSARMIMQVHDELVFEVPDAEIDYWLPVIRTAMASAADLHIPLVVDIGVGDNWDTAHL